MKYKLVAIGAGVLLLVAGLQSTPAQAGQQALRGNSAITLPLRTWARSYITLGMKTGKYAPHTQLSIPLLWLYDPAGRPVAFYMGSATAKLKSILVKFPESLEQASSLKDEPDLSLMAKVLQQAGARSLEKSRGKRYTAIFYAYATKQGLCVGCTKVAQLLQAAAKRHPGEWRIITVKLTRN